MKLLEIYSKQEILGFLRHFYKICIHQEIFYLWRPVLKDQKDDMILELAVAGNCDYIVTHNINQFISSAAAEKIAAIMTVDYLKKEAKLGKKKDFEAILKKVPDVEPEVLSRGNERRNIFNDMEYGLV